MEENIGGNLSDIDQDFVNKTLEVQAIRQK